MTMESYASWRMKKFFKIVFAPFKWMWDVFLEYMPLFIGAMVFIVFILWLFFCIIKPQNEARAKEEAALSSTSASSDSASSGSQDSSAAASATPPADDGSGKIVGDDAVFSYRPTGNVGLSILVDEGTGCQYIELKGQPLVPRMEGYTDNNSRQICNDKHQHTPDEYASVKAQPLTSDPNRPGYAEHKRKD